MAKRIKAEELEQALADIINDYADDVIKASQEAVETVGQIGVQKLQERAQKAGFKGTKYIKSFRVKKERGRLGATSTLYSTQYRIAHLLEHGHAIKNKEGNVIGKTKAYEHWKTAEEETSNLLEDTIKKAVGGTK